MRNIHIGWLHNKIVYNQGCYLLQAHYYSYWVTSIKITITIMLFSIYYYYMHIYYYYQVPIT